MTASKCFMFMYFLQPHWVPATWRINLSRSLTRWPKPSTPADDRRQEAAYVERARYNKAYYSLDCDDGTNIPPA